MPPTSVDSVSNPYDLDDRAETLLIAAGLVEAGEDDIVISAYPSRGYTPDSQHSHDYYPCLRGNAHGQAAPVYSCGCYRRSTKVEHTDAPEQLQELGPEQEVDSSGEIRPLKRKRSELSFESDSLGDLVMMPHHFGRNLTNIQRAKSVPALEGLKRRKLGKVFKLNRSATHETLILNVVKRLEAAIDRQTEVLSKIYDGVLESHAK
ncbi:uncharacterized protein F5891DRAFT_977416 [Suillus fuscotomentosus]|uniref:Uncharacterized protein n=1 Tax=Suillus fuscotomentosus TaxID=1912939 RepID=A0AAD4HN58_9AGAM|nr:uncharacterized protein F5891DRAFT_977416 [Suillus fuscotomentosus]KAG1903870.1 hypothetical protein F5891DRAFT_977416 [Suillus fuscotomentosus]